MTNEWALIIAAMIATIPGILAVIIGLLNARKVAELHVLINSGLDKLLASTTAAAISEGREQERTRQADLTSAHDAGRDEEKGRK